jgi:hypothetical protein
VKRADVRVVQTGDRTSLALESLLEVGVVGKVGRKDLYGDGAIETCILSPVNLSHAARTDWGENLVGT